MIIPRLQCPITLQRLILLLCSFLVLMASASGADNDPKETVPIFTNQDLERYKERYEKKELLEEPRPPKEEIGVQAGPSQVETERSKLKQHRVPYKPCDAPAKRILIPVVLNGSVTATMLVDTGAAGMFVSGKLAERLGIFEKDEGNLMETVAGIGGSAPAILTIIDSIRINSLKADFIPARVTHLFEEEFDGLVGMDFISDYSINIDSKDHVIVFEELPHSSDMPGGHDEKWWRNCFHEFAAKRAEWKRLMDSLYEVRDSDKPAATVRRGSRTEAVTVAELRKFAERQYNEAAKLQNKLNSYAIDHAVPMEWREY